MGNKEQVKKEINKAYDAISMLQRSVQLNHHFRLEACKDILIAVEKEISELEILIEK